MSDNEFERNKASYEQNSETFRSLNQIMWQVPIIAMTLTGGLWFGASQIPNEIVLRSSLLILAGVANIGLIFVLIRVRFVMGQILNKLESFNPRGFVAARGNKFYNRSHLVVTTFCVVLSISAAVSLIGAANSMFA